MKFLSFLLLFFGMGLVVSPSAETPASENKGGGDRVIGEPYASRSVVLGKNGMVATIR